ncbi:MAG: inorganic phosphate transporter [Candidatus Symbiothrix sp.]|jgi:PiT family inorganic phosphate transporter|nr:inorganic phosphate transporter [Candidatus Symbiothrix sp.]
MILLIAVIVLAFIFDYINGFHDAANSIATVVTTRVLTPVQAVIWAAFFNFVAFFIAKYWYGSFGIADTVSKVVTEGSVTLTVILAGLIAAITWNLITWRFGIPSSSSHTLIGGLAGAAIVHGGLTAINIKVISIIIAFIFVAPFVGMVAGMAVTIISLHLSRGVKPRHAEPLFKRLQLFSSAWLSINHGLNDSQKVMGVIGIALIYYNMQAGADAAALPDWVRLTSMEDIHDWVPFTCFTAIALGTMSGGWKIMKTMGNKITKLNAFEGFCTQMASSITLYFTEHYHIPVSTTHTITGAIMGVGSVKRLSAVRWGVTVDLIWAWIVTIPISALLAAIVYWILGAFGLS